MTEAQWGYLLLGIAAYQVLKILLEGINQVIIERRQKRFLKMVRLLIPEHGMITLIAIETSDKRAMARLERQLREQYDLIEDQEGEPYD
jgi:hypothetical protein